MPDESESAELFRLPVTQRDAWKYVWKAAGVAAYFWLYGHFVSIEKHDKDLEKIDTRQAMIERTLVDIDKNVTRVTQQLEDEEKRRRP